MFGYLDYRDFLAAWFDARKRANPRYSHRAFVRRTGQRSPSLLADVIAGRRNLTAAGLEGFLKALALTRSEARFFRLLVDLDQAGTPDERNAAWRDILATRRFRESRRLEGEGFRYLSTWYIPVVRELANRSAFRADPAWIASQVRPSITTRQAAEALEVLFELELLVRGEDGRVTHGGGSVVTPREVQSLAVQNYHRGMLERAREAIVEVPSDQRHFLAVTVAVPPALVPELKLELNALQDRILEICSGTPLPADQIMQFNLNFFPVSTPGEEEGT